MRWTRIGLVVASLALAQAAESQTLPAPMSSYADLADLALAAPVVAELRVRHAAALDPRDAPGVAPGFRRFLVDAEVAALIRGEGGLPERVSYLVDLADDSRGHAARPHGGDLLLVFAARAPNRPDELRLVARDAQLPFSPALADRTRAILREAAVPDAPPRITGIGRAFHVAGTLPGESETQIFLQTAGNRPISLSILRRPGEQPRWSVALSEIVDEAAAPPARDTLLWYRLACTLPSALPAQSLSEATPDEAAAIRADFALVIDGLGPCGRRRPRR
jgi:hypothetical protein